jgi:hypothetical protein
VLHEIPPELHRRSAGEFHPNVQDVAVTDAAAQSEASLRELLRLRCEPEVVKDRVGMSLDGLLAARVKAGGVVVSVGATERNGHLHVRLQDYAILRSRWGEGGVGVLRDSIGDQLFRRIVLAGGSGIRLGSWVRRAVDGVTQFGAKQHFTREWNSHR